MNQITEEEAVALMQKSYDGYVKATLVIKEVEVTHFANAVQQQTIERLVQASGVMPSCHIRHIGCDHWVTCEDDAVVSDECDKEPLYSAKAIATLAAKLEKAEKDAARYQRLLKDVEAVLAEMIKRLQDGEAMQGRVFVSLGITANRTLASIQAAIKGDSHEN